MTDLKNQILKFLKSNANGVTIDSILDYLDYINKVRYEKQNLDIILKELIIEKKLYLKDDLWFFYV